MNLQARNIDAKLKQNNLQTNGDFNTISTILLANKNKEKTEKLQTLYLGFISSYFFLLMVVFKICLFINQYLIC